MKNKTWGLVDSFFDKYDIVDHHIKSYNDFVENRIQKIIDITEPITIENEKGNYTLRTGKIKIEKPFTKEAVDMTKTEKKLSLKKKSPEWCKYRLGWMT